MHLKRSNIWKCIWAIAKNTAGQHLNENKAEKHLKIHSSIIRNYSWVASEKKQLSIWGKHEKEQPCHMMCRSADTSEKEQLSHMCRHIWKGATWKSRRSFVCSEHVLTEAGAPQTDNIFEDTIFVGYWSICQNLNIIFVEYRSICQNLNIFSNTKRSIARIANAVQVTMCLLVSTSVY